MKKMTVKIKLVGSIGASFGGATEKKKKTMIADVIDENTPRIILANN
jgi:hypothetical protein